MTDSPGRPAACAAKPQARCSRRALVALALAVLWPAPAPSLAQVPEDGAVPEICRRFDQALPAAADETRTYEIAMGIDWLDSRWPGGEIFRYWRRGAETRIVVYSRVTGTPFFGAGDYEHCRLEVWRAEPDGGSRLLRAEVFERNKNGAHEIEIAADPERDGYLYSFRPESEEPKSRFVEGPATIESVTTDGLFTGKPRRVMRIFGYGVYEEIVLAKPLQQTFGERTYTRHQMKGDLRRIAWFDQAEPPRLVRLCAAETLGAIIDGRVSKVRRPGSAAEADRTKAPKALEASVACAELDYD